MSILFPAQSYRVISDTLCAGIAIDDYAGKEDKLMKKYEKPNMEVIDIQNEVIVTSCSLVSVDSNAGLSPSIGGSTGNKPR